MASDASRPAYLSGDQRTELANCQQGDVLAIDRQVWLAHGDLPTTEYSSQYAVTGSISGLYESTPAGAAILTQTCDIVPRHDRDRPFVAIAPVVELAAAIEAEEAKRGRRPRYAHLPAYERGEHFVDLDRITTVETGVVLMYERTEGVRTDEERAAFARAIARKFSRFAFPDQLSESLLKWRRQVVAKHGKENSPEGELYRRAVDVRVTAAQGWQAEAIDVTISVLFPPGFLPIGDAETAIDVFSAGELQEFSASDTARRLCRGEADPHAGALLCEHIQRLWTDLCTPRSPIRTVAFELLGTDEMSVDSYLKSQSFDLEFLSPIEIPTGSIPPSGGALR